MSCSIDRWTATTATSPPTASGGRAKKTKRFACEETANNAALHWGAAYVADGRFTPPERITDPLHRAWHRINVLGDDEERVAMNRLRNEIYLAAEELRDIGRRLSMADDCEIDPRYLRLMDVVGQIPILSD